MPAHTHAVSGFADGDGPVQLCSAGAFAGVVVTVGNAGRRRPLGCADLRRRRADPATHTGSLVVGGSASPPLSEAVSRTATWHPSLVVNYVIALQGCSAAPLAMSIAAALGKYSSSASPRAEGLGAVQRPTAAHQSVSGPFLARHDLRWQRQNHVCAAGSQGRMPMGESLAHPLGQPTGTDSVTLIAGEHACAHTRSVRHHGNRAIPECAANQRSPVGNLLPRWSFDERCRRRSSTATPNANMHSGAWPCSATHCRSQAAASLTENRQPAASAQLLHRESRASFRRDLTCSTRRNHPRRSLLPVGWAFCNGQLLVIADTRRSFNLIGTTYGGDGRKTTFALPDLGGPRADPPGRPGDQLHHRQTGWQRSVDSELDADSGAHAHDRHERDDITARCLNGAPNQSSLRTPCPPLRRPHPLTDASLTADSVERQARPHRRAAVADQQLRGRYASAYPYTDANLVAGMTLMKPPAHPDL